MVNYSVKNYNPHNYQNYESCNPAFYGTCSQQYQNTLNYNYNYQPDTVLFSANQQIQPKQKKQGLSIGAKIAIGAAAIATLSIGADFIFCKGKHVKNLLANLKGNKVEPKVKPEVKTKVEPKVKPDVKPKVKPEHLAVNEAKLKAEKDLEQLSQEIPSMSHSNIAQQKYELNSLSRRLEMKAEKEGLTELENIKLDFSKRKLSLLEAREKQITQSIEQYVPDVSDNSAVSMHHDINGENSRIREAISDKAKNSNELSKHQIRNIEYMEERMAEIDKEFEQLPPLEKDCIVYRGRAENPIIKRCNKDFEIMEKAKVGDVIIPDTGYSYTAFHYDVANNWCQGGRMTDMDNNPLRTIMYKIRLPKGAKVSRNLEHRGEVVMPRSAQYKILDKKVGANGDIEAILEYILPKT